MNIQNLYPGSWGSNCYLLTVGEHAAVVDPSADAKAILNAVKAEGAKLEMILLTHGHFDHIVSVDTLRDATGAPLLCHRDDAGMLTDAHKNAFYTFFRMDRTYRAPEKTFSDGETLCLGEEFIRVVATPGHSPGSVCFDCNGEFLLTGDTLFAEGYGRYDLYGGDASVLFHSLRQLRELPQTLTIYPGHGDAARLGDALDTVIY